MMQTDEAIGILEILTSFHPAYYAGFMSNTEDNSATPQSTVLSRSHREVSKNLLNICKFMSNISAICLAHGQSIQNATLETIAIIIGNEISSICELAATDITAIIDVIKTIGLLLHLHHKLQINTTINVLLILLDIMESMITVSVFGICAQIVRDFLREVVGQTSHSPGKTIVDSEASKRILSDIEIFNSISQFFKRLFPCLFRQMRQSSQRLRSKLDPAKEIAR